MKNRNRHPRCRVPESPCRGCGKLLNGAAEAFGRARPHPGNISVCIYCGHLMAFADDMTLRDLTDEEMHEIAGDPMIIAVQRARAKVNEEWPDRSRRNN